MTAWWGRLSGGGRVAVVLLALVFGLNLLASGLQSVVGGDPTGPPASSYTTKPDGLAAWADLLQRRGHDVERRRRPLAEGRLDPSRTLVVADPRSLTTAGARRLARFLADGGRLVLLGERAAPLLGPDVGWAGDGPDRVGVLAPTAEVAGVRTVRGEGRGRFTDLGGLLPVLGADGATTAVVGRVGPGTVVALADGSPLANDHLAQADNARLALAVVGPDRRPVTFAEAEHGFGQAGGLAAVPPGWKWAGLLALVAFGAGAWSAARRFGPPEADVRALRPARLEHVEALAADLARVRPAPAEAAAPLVERSRRTLARRQRLDPVDADTFDPVRAAGAAAGLDPDEADALDRPIRDERDLLLVGRAAAKLAALDARRTAGPAPTATLAPEPDPEGTDR